jgi:hypothetical protein
MNARLPNFAERARGASVPASEGPEAPGAVSEQPAADEAALMNLLRLLNQLRTCPALTPVERAFVLGAKAVFQELAAVCDAVLAPPPASAAPPAAPPSAAPSFSAPEQPAAAEEAAPAGRTRASRRPTPGGGRLPLQ